MVGAESAEGPIAFADLRKITYREMRPSKSFQKIYEVIVTAASHNSMITGATGDLESCKMVIRQINALLGHEPTQTAVAPETLTEQEEDTLEE